MIKTFEKDGRLYVLVGTAHISSESLADIAEAFDNHSPNAVAVELDEERYNALMNPDRLRDIDVVSVMKQNKVASLLAQMFLAAFQHKVAKQLKQPLGQDMRAAIDFANTNHIPLLRIDRSVQVTLMRIWQSLSLMEKARLATELLSSLFESNITQEKIEALKQEDLLASALAEVGDLFPNVKRILIDERDHWMADALLKRDDDVIVAVVGAAHVPGILHHLEHPSPINDINTVDTRKKTSLWAWLFPIFLVGITLFSMIQTPALATQTLLRFIFINGSLAALGTLLALGHPLSALAAFVMAPVGLLSPVLATGFFAGMMEAYLRKPRVEDVINLSRDVTTLKGYWTNRVARILLIVFLANLFASLGSIIYSIDLVQRLFT